MVIPAGFAQVNLIFGGLAAPRGAQVTFGVVLNETNPTPTQVAGFAAAAWDAAGSVREQQDNDLILQTIRVKFGPNQTGPMAEVGIGLPGEFNTEGVPPQNAVLVRKITGGGGRKQMGRMFWPGLADLSVTANGLLVPAAQANWQGAMNVFLASLDTAGTEMVLLHSDATQPTPVLSLAVQSLTATQRRRIRRVGGRRRVSP